MAQVQVTELFKNPTVRNAAIGIGVAILVPVAVKYLAPFIRPVARSTVKAGLLALEKGRETAAELGEIFDDLIAEVREEMRIERESAQAPTTEEAAATTAGDSAAPKADAA